MTVEIEIEIDYFTVKIDQIIDSIRHNPFKFPPIIFHNEFHPPMFPLPYIKQTMYKVDSLPNSPTRTPVEQQKLKCKIIKL